MSGNNQYTPLIWKERMKRNIYRYIQCALFFLLFFLKINKMHHKNYFNCTYRGLRSKCRQRIGLYKQTNCSILTIFFHLIDNLWQFCSKAFWGLCLLVLVVYNIDVKIMKSQQPSKWNKMTNSFLWEYPFFIFF